MERGVDPKAWTYDNIARMRAELKRLGLSIDWSREFATCDPAYYGQQQALVPGPVARAAWSIARRAWSTGTRSTMTVLANEQVIDGRGWRSGAVVEKRKLNQWFLRITDYADAADRRPEDPGPLARQGPADAGELDRPLQGPALRASRFAGDAPRGLRRRAGGLHHPARHPVRRELRGHRRRPSAGRSSSRRAIPRPPPSSPSAARAAPSEAEIETAEKLGFDTGLRVDAPVRSRLGAAGLDRQLHADGLRHGRASSAARRTTSATSTSPASTACR